VVKDKPVLRQDIAAHLGASVIAQLTMPRRGLARLWRARRLVRERKKVAGTLVRLMRGGSGPISVLELGSRRIAAALTLDAATRLAADRNVVIVEDPAGRVVADDLPGRDLQELISRSVRPIRIVGADETAPARPGEMRIGIGSVTPGTAWTDLSHLGGETLLVVRTGFANTAWLHTVARQLADCGIPIVGVVLVDPDPRDRSDGTLWDGLHTALRGRAGRAPSSEAAEPRTEEKLPARPKIEPKPVAMPEPKPAEVVAEPRREQVPLPVLVAAPAAIAEPPLAAKPVPTPFPPPVPANGTNGNGHGGNGNRGNGTELPTRRIAPVQSHPSYGNGADHGTSTDQVHDLPTKRFAPVRPEDAQELAHRRTQS
jgi:hypothetical protein